MSSPDLAPQGPQGPPKKGSGPRPTMSQMFTAPKVQIQETKTVPLIDLQKLEADVTLLEAKKKAELLARKIAPKKTTAKKSIKGK